MKLTKKSYLIILVLSAALYWIYSFLLRNHVHNIFAADINASKTQYCAILISSVFGFSVFFLIIYATVLLYKRNARFMQYTMQFAIMFVPLFLLLLLTWPGIFKGDEFYVLEAIRSYTFSPAQTGLTSLFYISCLRFIPSMAAIPLFQIILICCIYSYIMTQLTDLYPGNKLVLCRIIFFLFPILDASLFTLRSTLVGWIFLLILSICYIAWKKQTHSIAVCLTISILTGLVIAWRSEYIYMLVLLPIYFATIQAKQKDNGTRKLLVTTIILTVAVTLCSFMLFNIPNKIATKGSNKYPISLVINPLGNIFAQDEIRGKKAYDDIMTISELLDVQALRNHPSVRNISQYWNIPDQLPDEQLDAFMSASYDLILNNFDHFLYYRWLTFKYTNGMVSNDINHPTAPTAETIYTLEYYGQDYHDRYYYMSGPLPAAVRNSIIDLLSCRHYSNENTTTNILYPIMYNCLPTFIIAFICMILCLYKKRYPMAMILFMSGIQVGLIFLTAPAMFFMYYFCFYISGYFLSALTYYELKDHKIKHSSNH